MDFYISNNLTKSEFKAVLSRGANNSPLKHVAEGYPSLNFSFKKNTLSFTFFAANAKEPAHIADLEFYFCTRTDDRTATLQSNVRPEVYALTFKSEECSLTFASILSSYLKMRELNRRQFE